MFTERCKFNLQACADVAFLQSSSCAWVTSRFSLFLFYRAGCKVTPCFVVSSQGLWCWDRQGLIGDYCQICFHPCNLSASKHDVGLSTDYIPGLWKATKGKRNFSCREEFLPLTLCLWCFLRFPFSGFYSFPNRKCTSELSLYKNLW